MGRRNILITGGAGFIGSHLVRLFVNKYPDYHIVNFDKLTYAGCLENLRDVEGRANYTFVRGDVCDSAAVKAVFSDHEIDGVIHLAAESHVDRSIEDPLSFARTNVFGTLTLLEAAREAWEPLGWKIRHGDGAGPEAEAGAEAECRFHHVSTDEVYGSLDINRPRGARSYRGAPTVYGTGFFKEDSPYSPHSPYSASKASADHFVRAFHDTYGMPTVVTNCSNNYGPNQFPEKLIPLTINNILNRRPIPVYGAGKNVRDWLYVGDHAGALDVVFHRGRPGETYNIGGSSERKNIDLVRDLIRVEDRLLGREEGEDLGLITFVGDRKGHDRRYAIDAFKIRRDLGWEASVPLEEGLEKTVRWYLDNRDWLESVTSGDYLNYYDRMYSGR